MKLTLIVPIFNAEKYIRGTLESIVSSIEIDVNEFECLLVNESSTDESGEICDEFAAKYPFFHHYVIPHNGVYRPSFPRNFGMDMAKGDYVMFLDADDFWIPGAMKTYIGFLDNHLEYDLYIGNYYNFLNGNENNLYVFAEHQINVETLVIGPALFCCIFRRDVLEGFRFRNTPSEDITFTGEILLSGFKFNYDNSNPVIYKVNSKRKDPDKVSYRDMDLHIKNNVDWVVPIVNILSRYPNYKYTVDENNNVVYKPV